MDEYGDSSYPSRGAMSALPPRNRWQVAIAQQLMGAGQRNPQNWRQALANGLQQAAGLYMGHTLQKEEDEQRKSLAQQLAGLSGTSQEDKQLLLSGNPLAADIAMNRVSSTTPEKFVWKEEGTPGGGKRWRPLGNAGNIGAATVQMPNNLTTTLVPGTDMVVVSNPARAKPGDVQLYQLPGATDAAGRMARAKDIPKVSYIDSIGPDGRPVKQAVTNRGDVLPTAVPQEDRRLEKKQTTVRVGGKNYIAFTNALGEIEVTDQEAPETGSRTTVNVDSPKKANELAAMQFDKVLTAAEQSNNKLADLDTAIGLLEGIDSGGGAETRLNVGRYLRGLGKEWDANTGKLEAAQALLQQSVIETLNEAKGPQTDRDYERALKSLPTLMNTREGLGLIRQMREREAFINNELVRAVEDIGDRHISGELTAWEARRLLNDAQKTAIAEGQRRFPIGDPVAPAAAPAAPAAPAAAPVGNDPRSQFPDAQQDAQGNWFVIRGGKQVPLRQK